MDLLALIKTSKDSKFQLGLYQNKYLVFREKTSETWQFCHLPQNKLLFQGEKGVFVSQHPELFYSGADIDIDVYNISFLGPSGNLSNLSWGEHCDILDCYKRANYPRKEDHTFYGVCYVPELKPFAIVKKHTVQNKKMYYYWSALIHEKAFKPFVDVCEENIYIIKDNRGTLMINGPEYLPYNSNISFDKIKNVSDYSMENKMIGLLCRSTKITEEKAKSIFLHMAIAGSRPDFYGFYLQKSPEKIIPVKISYVRMKNTQYAKSVSAFDLPIPELQSLVRENQTYDMTDNLYRVINLQGAVFHLEPVEIISSKAEINPETIYTEKIDVPEYCVTGPKPNVSELADLSDYNKLLENIAADKSLSDENRTFLELAAARHINFHYDRIAEYYAHASDEVKNLMEQLALVIIPYEKALAFGFVKEK